MIIQDQMLRSTDSLTRKGAVCPYCGNEFKAGEFIVRCPIDQTPHHVACWQANLDHCTTLGCTGQGPIVSASSQPSQPQRSQQYADQVEQLQHRNIAWPSLRWTFFFVADFILYGTGIVLLQLLLTFLLSLPNPWVHALAVLLSFPAILVIFLVGPIYFFEGDHKYISHTRRIEYRPFHYIGAVIIAILITVLLGSRLGDSFFQGVDSPYQATWHTLTDIWRILTSWLRH